MFKALRWRMSVAMLLGALLALGALVGPAQARVGRTVSVKASPTAVAAGAHFTLAGRVTNTPKGKKVQVQRSSGSGWTTLRTLTTGASGSYSARIRAARPAGLYAYRVVAPKSGKLARAVSVSVNARSLRPVKVTISSRPKSSPAPGAKITLRGKVAPFRAGAKVIVQRKAGSSWRKVGTAKLNSSGRFSRVSRPQKTIKYRVISPRRGNLARDISNIKTVRVPVPPRVLTSSLPTAAQAFGYSATLRKSGAAGRWSITKGFLPFGLDLKPKLGVITGTPTESGIRSFTVKFTETDSGLSATKALSLRVLESSPPEITTEEQLGDATKRVAYSAQLLVAGQPGTWSKLNGTLPPGLSLNSGSGEISGTPTRGGDFQFTVRYVEDESNLTDTQLLRIHVIAVPPTITTSSLPQATQDDFYSVTLAKTGGAGSWSLGAGELPPGLSLNGSTGVLSGTPTTAGEYDPFTVVFTESDADGLSDSQELQLSVSAPDSPEITTASPLPDGEQDVAYGPVQFETDSVEAGTWTAGAGLPSGLALDSAGELAGTPTESGDFAFTVRFTETDGGLFGEALYELHIDPPADEPPVITTISLPSGTQGVGYNATLEKTGDPGTWSIDAGALPAGIALNPNTGLLSGTPTAAGDFDITVKFTETGSGLSDTQELTLTIAPGVPPEITTTTLPAAPKGASYSVTLQKTGKNGVWSRTSGNLPAGMTLSSNGVLSGKPTASGDFAFTVKFTETASTLFDTQSYSLHVSKNQQVVIRTYAIPDGSGGVPYSFDLSSNLTDAAQWSITGGSLAGSGLSLSQGGTLSGANPVAGTYTIKVKCAPFPPLFDDEQTFTFTIAP